MKTKYMAWLAMGGLGVGACVVDKQLGETESDGASSVGDDDDDDDDDADDGLTSLTAGDDDDDDDAGSGTGSGDDDDDDAEEAGDDDDDDDGESSGGELEPEECNPTWETERITDSLPVITPDREVQLGPDGTLHVFFGTYDAAYHAQRVDGSWDVSDFPATELNEASGFVDDAGVPHVVWGNAGQVHVARRVGDDWEVESDAFECEVSSVVQTSDGVLHTAGHLHAIDKESKSDQVCYGRRSASGEWSSELVGEADARGTGLVVDEDGTAYISFHDIPYVGIATNAFGGWQFDDLGRRIFGGFHSQMERGPDGQLYVAHTRSNWTVELLVGVPGGWTNEVVYSPGGGPGGANPAGMAFDAEGALHMAHINPLGGCVRHRVRADNDEPWEVVDIAEEPEGVRFTDMIVGPDLVPHVVYSTGEFEMVYASPTL